MLCFNYLFHVVRIESFYFVKCFVPSEKISKFLCMKEYPSIKHGKIYLDYLFHVVEEGS